MEEMTAPTGASFCYNKASPVQPAEQVVQDDNGMKKTEEGSGGSFRETSHSLADEQLFPPLPSQRTVIKVVIIIKDSSDPGDLVKIIRTSLTTIWLPAPQ